MVATLATTAASRSEHGQHVTAPLHRLQRAHFAFMRALLQGMDERQSWDRYLRVDGETADRRTVRRTIAWIRDEFATAARRAERPGTARLILMDAERLDAVQSLPTLEEFAAQQGLEDFSFAEQAQAYAQAHPAAASASRRRPNRRARVVERQLAALRWLEAQVSKDPRPEDAVEAWLNPAVARRLEDAGLHTLGSLVMHINAQGARWWRHVPGVGEGKARRVVSWLRAQSASSQLLVGDHAMAARTVVSTAALDAVVLPATALVPLEKLQLPPALDGHAGRLRAPPSECRLPASNDLEAIAAWLAGKGGGGSNKVASSATYRAYRKEAERLLLWSVLIRGLPLSSLGPEDAERYATFLSAPPTEWCGPRHNQRWSPRWRPLEGPVSQTGKCHAWAVLNALFRFLVLERYLISNPFEGRPQAASLPSPSGRVRALTYQQWAWLEPRLDDLHGSSGRRLARALRWLHATGLRPSELIAVRCEDLVPPGSGGNSDEPQNDWTLRVKTAQGGQRRLILPQGLVDELNADLVRYGFAAGLSTPGVGGVPVLARHEEGVVQGWTASGMAKAIKAWLRRLSEDVDEEDAIAFGQASAKWFRHIGSEPTAMPNAQRKNSARVTLRSSQGDGISSTASEFRSAAL